MNKLLKIGLNYPWQTVGLVILITILALLSLPNLRLEITAEGMMVKDDPNRQFYERALDTFGSDNVTILYVEDQDLFDREKLLVLQRVVKQLGSSPMVDRAVSLFSVRYIRTKEGYTYTEPYLKKIPNNRDELETIKVAALHNPLVSKNLLSEDGTAMAINIFLDTSDYQRGFDEKVNAHIKEVIQPLHSEFEKVFYLGDPYVRAGITERIKADQTNIIPASIALLVITLAFTLRQLIAALIPLLTASISILWTLGLMAVVEVPVNVMTSIIPALLIIIGSTEDIHLLTEYRSATTDSKSREIALQKVANNMWLAVLLTFITTYLGFLSISFGNLELLKQFGLVASTGLLLNFIITILVVPILLRFFSLRSSKKIKDQSQHLLSVTATLIFNISTKYRNTLLTAIILVGILSIYFASQVHVNNNVMDYFDEDSELKIHAQTLHNKLSGIQTFSIILTGSEGTFLQVPYLQELWDLQSFLMDTGYLDSSYSFADFIGVIHTGLDGEWVDLIYLPDRNEVVRGYMSLLDQSSVRTFVSPDFSQARILVRHNITSSEKLRQTAQIIESYAETWIDPSLEVNVTGESYLNSRAADYLAEGQFYGLLLILSAIFLIVSFLFMNMKAGLIAVLSNILPIIVLFGFMGFFGIPINTGTSMVAAISVGVCVDYTMHFMVRYQRLSRQDKEGFIPLFETFKEEAAPIISTALALSAGFLALSLSDFPPVARFGQLSALVMLTALVSTFIFTATMLQNTRLITVWDILSMGVKRHVLNNCPLFKDMHQWQSKKVIAMSEMKKFIQDEAIMLQAQPVNQLYILLEGEVEAWRTRSDGSTYKVNVTKPGGVFGVLLPDEGQKCFADMVASKPSRMMVLKWDDLHNISKTYPRLAVHLYKNLSIVISSMLLNTENSMDKFYDESSGALDSFVFRDVLESMVQRANRYDEDLTVFCLKVNNNLGLASNQQLAQNKVLGLIIQSNIRTPDSFGRFSKKTLSIAFPKTSMDEANRVMKRLIDELNQERILNVYNTQITYQLHSLEVGETPNHFFQRISNEQENESAKDSAICFTENISN